MADRGSFIPQAWLDEALAKLDAPTAWDAMYPGRRERAAAAAVRDRAWREAHPWLARRREIRRRWRRLLDWRWIARERLGYAVRALRGEWGDDLDD